MTASSVLVTRSRVAIREQETYFILPTISLIILCGEVCKIVLCDFIFVDSKFLTSRDSAYNCLVCNSCL